MGGLKWVVQERRQLGVDISGQNICGKKLPLKDVSFGGLRNKFESFQGKIEKIQISNFDHYLKINGKSSFRSY
jgi:hypothetical protein